MQPKEQDVNDFFSFFGDKHQFFSLPNKAETGYYGTYEKNAIGLQRDNQAGKDIYFTVNQAKAGIQRTKDRYVKTRAVYIDDDGPDKHGGATEGFPIEPNIVVSSSPGKFHYYWLTSTEDRDASESVLRGMAETYNGDPTCVDCLRILRAPGFIHNGSGQLVTYQVNHANIYSWDEILKHFPPQVESTPKIKDDRDQKFSVKEAIDEILSGDQVHGARIRLALHWANTGMPKQDALDTLNGYVEDAMRSGNIDRGRAMERLSNMKQAVETAYKKVDAENAVPKFEVEEVESLFTEVPEPVGNMKPLIEDIMAFMVHPSLEMATAVAFHCVSVFGGGIYHLDGKTCARKRTILAPTGRGKSIANRYFSELIRRMALKEDMFNPYKFIGGSHYAVNNIHLELVEHRVRSYITSEAGLMGKSKAGTTHETRAYLLNVIAGDYTEGFDGRQLSARSAENRKVNEGLKTVYSAIPVLLSESVPDQYVDVLKSEDSFRSGDVGREELFFIDPFKAHPNRKIKRDLSDKIVDMMFNLARSFEATKSEHGDQPNNPDCFVAADTSKVDTRLDELFQQSIDAYNSANFNFNHIDLALSSRWYEKILTTCLVQAIADMKPNKKKPPVPVVTLDHLEYAVQYHTALSNSLRSQATGTGALSDPLEQCIQRVLDRCITFGSKVKDKREAHDVSNKIIRRGWITDVLDRANFKPIDNLINNTFRGNRRQAMAEVISALEDKRIIVPITNINSKVHLWKINI